MRLLNLKVAGTTPMIMHSARFANPLDPLTKAHKALTSKRKKTDEDHEAIMRSEWNGSLYLMQDAKKVVVGMPGINVDGSFFEGAKLDKNGSLYKRAVQPVDNIVPLQYPGSKDFDKMYESGAFVDVRGVKVGAARVMRCRPIFPEWSFEISFVLDETMINVDQFIEATRKAGRYIGLCDFRPGKRGNFGKFVVEVLSDNASDDAAINSDRETDQDAAE